MVELVHGVVPAAPDSASCFHPGPLCSTDSQVERRWRGSHATTTPARRPAGRWGAGRTRCMEKSKTSLISKDTDSPA